MDEGGKMTPHEDVNMAMNKRPVKFGDMNISKGQLEVRFRRFTEQILTVQELIIKIRISVNRLENENQSLREQIEFYHSCPTTEAPPQNPPQRNPGDKKPKPTLISAAKIALRLIELTVGRMHDKMVTFEKMALADKAVMEETLRHNGQIKAMLVEANLKLRAEKKKNELYQEKTNFLQNAFLNEAMLRLAAERRCYSFEKQVVEMKDELLAQRDQMFELNIRQLGDDLEDSPFSNDHLVSSTPHTTPYRTIDEPMMESFASPHDEPKDGGKIPWKGAAKFTRRFRKIFSDIEENCRQLMSKVKSFAETKPYFMSDRT